VCTPSYISSLQLAMREYADTSLINPMIQFCLLLASRSLREMDIELMRRLSPRVNVIPVIGKADSLTPSELKAFKRRVSFSIFCGVYAVDVSFCADYGGH
jgi:Septin